MASDCTPLPGLSAEPWPGAEATPLLQPNGPQRGQQRSAVGQQQGSECDPPAAMWPHFGEVVTHRKELHSRCVEDRRQRGQSVPWQQWGLRCSTGPSTRTVSDVAVSRNSTEAPLNSSGLWRVLFPAMLFHSTPQDPCRSGSRITSTKQMKKESLEVSRVLLIAHTQWRTGGGDCHL